MKFFEYTQNNSGGSFVVDDKLTHRLFIEADSEEKANEIAESMGVYFNGCSDDRDCSCCGDRWYSPSKYEFPYAYGSFDKEEAEKIAEKYKAKIVESKSEWKSHDVIFPTVEALAQYLTDDFSWEKPDARIFYKNGKVKEIYK